MLDALAGADPLAVALKAIKPSVVCDVIGVPRIQRLHPSAAALKDCGTVAAQGGAPCCAGVFKVLRVII